MAEYAPDQNFKHPVCRGSWALGNNCKVCERCQATHPSRAGTQLLTNPKHTDTSRSGDLVKRLRDRVIYDSRHYTPDPLLKEAADRIEALEAENERLRETLGLADAALRGANMNMNVVERKVRTALGEKQ